MSISNTFDSDVNWVKLLNNKLVINDLVQHGIKESNNSNIVFHGSFCVGKYLHNLIDEETIDLVSINLKLSNKIHNSFRGDLSKFVGKGLGYQRHYNTIEQYLDDHTPVKNKINIYYIGDVSSSTKNEKYYSVHWNCFIVDFTVIENEGISIWYDPSYDESQVEDYNNFDQSLKSFVESLLVHKYSVKNCQTICSKHRAQQIVNPEFDSVDIFCQTYCIFFSLNYIENNLEKYLNINYPLYQAHVLKSWIYCILQNMDEYKTYHTENRYSGLLYCRIEDKFDTIKVEPIVRLKRLEKTCTKTVVDYFYEN